MSWVEAILLVACVVLVVCPRRYDPAIRLKEMNMIWAARLGRRRRR